MVGDEPEALRRARAEIDALDGELLSLLARRAVLVEGLFAWKRQVGLPLFDAEREARLVATWRSRAVALGLPAAFAERVAAAVLDDSHGRAGRGR